MHMARSLLLGLLLVLVAIGYQYREQLQSIFDSTHTTTSEGVGSKRAEERSKIEDSKLAESEDTDSGGIGSKSPEDKLVSPTEERTAGPDIKSFPEPQYYNPPFDPEDPPRYSKSGTRLITLNELAAHAHNGTLKPLWLAVMGRVYDVDKGAENYYGPNGGYNFFTGRDGSRAFVTGEFNEEGLTDDIEGLSPAQVGEVDGWVKLYDKDYTFVGKLIARYYTKDGSPTKYWYKYQKALSDKAKLDAEQEKLKLRYPGCNSQWTIEDGGKVSCSNGSGGIQRDWVGYPRRYFAPGSKSWRCACVHEDDLDGPSVRLYPSCEPTATECKVYPDQLSKLRETGG